MDRLKTEAEHLRLGIRGGWLAVEQAVAWADRQIAQTRAPHLALLDVALARTRSREDVVALLAAVPGTAEMTRVMRWCLADLLDVVQRQPDVARDVARWVDVAADEGFLPRSEFGSEPTALEDAFLLAEHDGYGTVSAARKRLLSFLREHAHREE